MRVTSADTRAMFQAVAPAASSTPAANSSTVDLRAEIAELTAPVTLELVNAEPSETLAVNGAMSSFGGRTRIVHREISAHDAIRKGIPDPDPRPREALQRRISEIDRILSDPSIPPAKRQLLLQIKGRIETQVRVAKRQEEKVLLMKKIIKQLMAGVLTPSTITQAKALGLGRFVKEAVQDLARSGTLTPQAIKSIAVALAAAGIVMPELFEMLTMHDKQVLGDVNAARTAKGLAPTALVGATMTGGAGSAPLGLIGALSGASAIPTQPTGSSEAASTEPGTTGATSPGGTTGTTGTTGGIGSFRTI